MSEETREIMSPWITANVIVSVGLPVVQSVLFHMDHEFAS
jgi:hypothetical protein